MIPDGAKIPPEPSAPDRSVALLADTHGQLDPRIRAALAQCHQVVHAGDIGSAAVLEQLGLARTVAVRGNNDVAHNWREAEQPLLATLGDEARLALPGGELVVVHGHRAGRVAERHAWLRQRYPQARLVLYGHSHRLAIDCSATPWVVNPGAAGRARTHGGPSCLLLHIRHGIWQIEPLRFPPLPRGLLG